MLNILLEFLLKNEDVPIYDWDTYDDFQPQEYFTTLFKDSQDLSSSCVIFIRALIDFFDCQVPPNLFYKIMYESLKRKIFFLNEYFDNVYPNERIVINTEKEYDNEYEFYRDDPTNMLYQWLIAFWNVGINILKYLSAILKHTTRYFTSTDVEKAVVIAQQKLNLGSELLEDWRKAHN